MEISLTRSPRPMRTNAARNRRRNRLGGAFGTTGGYSIATLGGDGGAAGIGGGIVRRVLSASSGGTGRLVPGPMGTLPSICGAVTAAATGDVRRVRASSYARAR